MYSLGKKVKSLRKEMGLKQEELTCDILSRTMLSKIENDKVTPSIYQLDHISKKLGVSIEFFLQTDSLPYHNNEKFKDSLYKLFENENYLAIISKYEKNIIDINTSIDYSYYVGYSYYKMHFYNHSIKLLNSYIKTVFSLKEDDTNQYIENVSNAFNVISVIYFELEDYSKAIQYSLKAKDILQKNNILKTRQYFMIINNLGYMYNTISDYKQCINLLEEFLSYNKELIYLQIFASIHISLSSAYYNIGDYEHSIEHIQKAIFFFIYIKDEQKAIECYLNYINALRYSKKYDEAIKLLDKVVLKYEDNFDSSLRISFIMQKAILEFNIRNFDASLEELTKLNIKNLDSYNRNCYYFMKGHIAFINNELDLSKTYFKNCEKFFINSNYVYDLGLLYNDLYAITSDSKYSKLQDKLIDSCDNPRKNIVIQ
ncbi:MAG: helix-turn-helix transcriptional regulator [Clostridium sp.]|uniref:helix-turn-helix transcriptional regulator n=1 Tax=Clostridium sp. TaxID=1506 RepID=UPI002904DF36|nr:helix-turn-helix transcriptional regulator [Clostridium sp.]MDU2755294.1 helix-turn-helix transcriptional regulator [Clostridium sp.]MDU2900960.1 helix-turn-helix transcriptional regulator [Clostridium sp.]MDU4426244.1 helix-turn-helix transcriptional regulator [Clostridium sp.]MDU7460243.1 helix-turn-helix transcriptional regulator [Clostridium sp.]